MNNLPVYLDYRNGHTHTLTQIRKIDGNVMVCQRERERERGRTSLLLFIYQIHSSPQAMERMLRIHLNEKQLLSRVDELTGSIVLHGNYREEVKLWLLSLGF